MSFLSEAIKMFNVEFAIHYVSMLIFATGVLISLFAIEKRS